MTEEIHYKYVHLIKYYKCRFCDRIFAEDLETRNITRYSQYQHAYDTMQNPNVQVTLHRCPKEESSWGIADLVKIEIKDV